MKSPVIDIASRRQRQRETRERIGAKLAQAGWWFDGVDTWSLQDGEYVFYVTMNEGVWEVLFDCPYCQNIHRPGAAWHDPFNAMFETTAALGQGKQPAPCPA